MRKTYRVKTEKDFQRVFHQGTSVANRQLVLYVYPKPEQENFRIGLSVGKKLGNAVERNYIKRLLREAVRANASQIKASYDYILIARPDIKGRSLQEIKRSMIHVMTIADVIKPEHSLSQYSGGTNEKQ